MQNHDLQQLVGAELTALGVLRHRRTGAEFMQVSESHGQLEVSELLFLKPRRTEATFIANRWFGNLHSIDVQQLVEDDVPLQKYKLNFDAGFWLVIAEGHALNVFQTIAQASHP